MKLQLLSKDDLITTGNVDHADWNFKLILGYIQKTRFKLCLKLMGRHQFNRILEIGYGSGVFIPELKNYGKEIYGVDIHNFNNEVTSILNKKDIKVKLFSGSVEKMPFEDNFFDLIVSVSAIEFIDNIENACHEIKRVLKKDGYLIVITPGYSKFIDFGVKILTGKKAEDDYNNRRATVIPILLQNFELIEIKSFPFLTRSFLKLYTALKLKKK